MQDPEDAAFSTSSFCDRFWPGLSISEGPLLWSFQHVETKTDREMPGRTIPFTMYGVISRSYTNDQLHHRSQMFLFQVKMLINASIFYPSFT